jgi:hypothetical protein
MYSLYSLHLNAIRIKFGLHNVNIYDFIKTKNTFTPTKQAARKKMTFFTLKFSIAYMIAI